VLGYQQYEVSAWAIDERRRCRHNVNYWLFGDYLAAGAGAHGKISDVDGVMRYRKPANPVQYMMTQEREFERIALTPLSPNDQMFEFMLNALRLNNGFAEDLFVKRTSLSGDDLMQASVAAREKGLMERSADGFWRPTELGARFLNDLQSEFIVEGA